MALAAGAKRPRERLWSRASAGMADLFRQTGSIKNDPRPKKRIFLDLGQAETGADREFAPPTRGVGDFLGDREPYRSSRRARCLCRIALFLKETTVPFTLSRFCSADEEEADDRNQPSSAPPRVRTFRSPAARFRAKCGADADGRKT